MGIVHTVLSGACTYAVRMEVLDRNPMTGAPPQRQTSGKWTLQQSLRSRRSWPLSNGSATGCSRFCVYWSTPGCVSAKPLGLRWSNVNLDQGYVRVVEAAVKTHRQGMITKRPKTTKGVRTIDLDDRTIEVLRRLRLKQFLDDYQGEFVFPHCDGGLMRVTTIIRDLKRLGERVGVPGITFHSLQHFHASVSLQQHQNVVVVSRRLGHSSVVTTLDTYGHVMAGWQKGEADAFAEAMETND